MDPVALSQTQQWTSDNEALVKNLLEPVVQYFKETKDKPEEEVKSIVKKLVNIAGLCRPATASSASGSSSSKAKKKQKEQKEKDEQDRHLRFLGECCVCGLEKRGNYDRLGFLCAGCRTVPLKQVQSASSTRVPRVRYSPHYVPSVAYPREFHFLSEFYTLQGLMPLNGGKTPPTLQFSSPFESGSSFTAGSSPASGNTFGASGAGAGAGGGGGGSGRGSGASSSSSRPTSASASAAGSGLVSPLPGGGTAAGGVGAGLGLGIGVSAATAGGGGGGGSKQPVSFLQQPVQESGFGKRYTVFQMQVPSRHETEMLNEVDALRLLYHPSFLYNFAISRDLRRNSIWLVHETAHPIELRGALLSGHRCYELLRQISVAALQGLMFLKDFNGRTHNDLRPHNFFIDDRHRVKLRLAPFPQEDLPAPFSYENSFFAVNQTNQLIPTVSGSSFGVAPSDGGTEPGGDPTGSSNLGSQRSTRTTGMSKQVSFASKIDSYCLSRNTSRRHQTVASGGRDMFVLGVTLTLIAYGDVENLPLPNDDEVGSDPDELFLVEFIWRLLTGERTPDEALRDDYLTTVRLVDGVAIETIVLRAVCPQVPADVHAELVAQAADGVSIVSSKKANKAAAYFTSLKRGASGGDGEKAVAGEKSIKFAEEEKDKEEKEASPAEKKQKEQMDAALNAASIRFKVNRWSTGMAKLVSFLNNGDVPAGESEKTAADPKLFQVVRTPTQLTFYSVRRDPRLLRARQISSERSVASFNNALLASSSMTLAAKNMPSASSF